MPLPALVHPEDTNFLKDWPSQNSYNCETIDDYAGPCLPAHPLQTYTPAWTATTTNPTLGTGAVLRGFYYLIFDQVFTWGEALLGSSGAARGSGIYEISLPFKAKTHVTPGTIANQYTPIGNAQAFKLLDTAERQPMVTLLRTTTTMMFGVRMDTSSGLRKATESNPFLFNASDGIMWSARYQRDTS